MCIHWTLRARRFKPRTKVCGWRDGRYPQHGPVVVVAVLVAVVLVTLVIVAVVLWLTEVVLGRPWKMS